MQRTKVINLVKNNSLFRADQLINCGNCILPANTDMMQRHADPRQEQHRWRPCTTLDKLLEFILWGSTKVLLSQLIAGISVATMSGQDEAHLLFVYVLTRSILIFQLADPRVFSKPAVIGMNQVALDGLLGDVVKCKMILEEKCVDSLLGVSHPPTR
jgi:hypothetical protein